MNSLRHLYCWRLPPTAWNYVTLLGLLEKLSLHRKLRPALQPCKLKYQLMASADLFISVYIKCHVDQTPKWIYWCDRLILMSHIWSSMPRYILHFVRLSVSLSVPDAGSRTKEYRKPQKARFPCDSVTSFKISSSKLKVLKPLHIQIQKVCNST